MINIVLFFLKMVRRIDPNVSRVLALAVVVASVVQQLTCRVQTICIRAFTKLRMSLLLPLAQEG